MLKINRFFKKELIILAFTLKLFFLDFSKCVFLIIEPSQVECIWKEVKVENGLKGKYLIAGENETNNQVIIKDSNKNIVWNNSGRKESEFNIDVGKNDIYEVCFENLDNKYLTGSFDFYDTEISNQAVTTQSITDMNKNVHEMRKIIDIIHYDMRNSAIRRKVHLDSKIFILNISIYNSFK